VCMYLASREVNDLWEPLCKIRDEFDDSRPPLPKRIIVDQNGHYWRDFGGGDSLSMCPTSDANEPTEIAATYEPAQHGHRPGEWKRLMKRLAKEARDPEDES